MKIVSFISLKEFRQVNRSLMGFLVVKSRIGYLYVNKHESPSPKDALCQAWLKWALWFWRRFLKFVNVFSLLRNYLPLQIIKSLAQVS